MALGDALGVRSVSLRLRGVSQGSRVAIGEAGRALLRLSWFPVVS